jgi:hypothetical protein
MFSIVMDNADHATVAQINDSGESSALDSWQEATIILCVALVGLIYLVTSRASPDSGKEKKPSLADKYLT